MALALSSRPAVRRAGSRRGLQVQAKTIVRSIEVYTGKKDIRTKADETKGTPALLTRVEQLKLLSKAEEAGLLTLAEKLGLSLSTIEELGLLSKAESIGALSLATDRNSPALLQSAALALFAAGPAGVYLLPDESLALVAAQAVLALTCVAGGAAALGGSLLLADLQKA